MLVWSRLVTTELEPGSEWVLVLYRPQFTTLLTIGGGQWDLRFAELGIGTIWGCRLPILSGCLMSPPDASVHSRIVVPLGGQQWPAGECTEVTQCAGSVRACAARGSEARGEGHCASCQLMRSGVMPPASVKESEMWQNHYEWELLIVTPKTGENFLACLM